MPRAKLETAFIGRYTLAALDAAPDAAFLWLGRALFAWILRDELPQDIPPEHLTAWTMIREESAFIHESRKQFAEAGRKGGEANASEHKRKEANASEGKRTETKIESKSKIEKETPASAGDGEKKNTQHAPAREVWLDDLTECPIPPDKLKVLAAHLELSPDDISAWKDYYTAQGWRRWPNSMRPMTQAAAEAALRFWKTKKGIEAAKEAHIDAKMDERAEKRAARIRESSDPSRFAPPPEKGGIDAAALGI